MYWSPTVSMIQRSGVGQVVPHMINAVVAAETGADTAIVVTTAAATTNAPTRPMYFA